MEILYATILGIVQGITEFVPVSSSGHLVILHEWLNLNLQSDLAFDVALHTGTLVALIIFFYKDIIGYIKNKDKLLYLILIAIVPAGIIGLLFEDIIDFYLRSIWVVVLMLILIGIAFLYFEQYSAKNKNLKSLTWKKALVIGIAQVLALIPGTSRSGITILAGMGYDLKREQAARFSFLIGLPIFAGAGLKKAYDLSKMEIQSQEWLIFAVGFFVSAIVGYFCVKYLLKFLEKHSLKGFAYYRFGLAVVLIIYLLFNSL